MSAEIAISAYKHQHNSQTQALHCWLPHKRYFISTKLVSLNYTELFIFIHVLAVKYLCRINYVLRIQIVENFVTGVGV